jgi:hypothetical protein
MWQRAACATNWECFGEISTHTIIVNGHKEIGERGFWFDNHGRILRQSGVFDRPIGLVIVENHRVSNPTFGQNTGLSRLKGLV